MFLNVLLKDHTTDFTHTGQLTLHEEYCTFCENRCKMFVHHKLGVWNVGAFTRRGGSNEMMPSVFGDFSQSLLLLF